MSRELIMTRMDFLDEMKAYTELVMKDLRLPRRIQTEEERDAGEVLGPPTVYKMRLPDSSSQSKYAPYILHQLVTADDVQEMGKRTESSVLLRTIFCLYHPIPDDDPDEDEGALRLVEIMERFRISLLRDRVVADRYTLDLKRKLEALYYPDDMRPYFIGEYASNWTMPSIEREKGVREFL